MLPLVTFLISAQLIHARSECSMVIGRLKCPTEPSKAVHARVDLFDEDSLPLEVDDLMGRTWSGVHGDFKVTGCGDDFGPLNTPDPYLYIVHDCPHRTTNETAPIQVDVIPLFFPSIVNLGTIYLDRYIDDVE